MVTGSLHLPGIVPRARDRNTLPLPLIQARASWLLPSIFSLEERRADPIADFRLDYARMPRSSSYVEPQRFLEFSNASPGRALALFVRFAARFCFRDLADFLVMLCLGDLSDIAALCFWGPIVGPCSEETTAIQWAMT